eukprot:SM000132S26914  [mRNA]  locus=s132:299324:301803:- [translate_table: standard]
MAAFAAAALVALTALAGFAGAVQNNAAGHYLYIWAGEANKTLGDTMFVIGWNNALVGGHPYGTIITYNVLNSPTGNEPGSMSLANFNYLMAGAGSLSFYTGQQKKPNNEVFFWNMTDAKNIKPLAPKNPPLSASPQDFYPLANGGFLVTMLADPYGGEGGRLAEFDNATNVIAEYPDVPPPGFCPKGIAVHTQTGFMLTTDYYVLNSTFNYPTPSSGEHQASHQVSFASALLCLPVAVLSSAPDPRTMPPVAGIVAFSTIRVWNFTTRTILSTVTVPDAAAGLLQVKFLPGDSQAKALVVGRFSGKIYYLATKTGVVSVALDLNTLPGVGPGSKPGQMELITGRYFNQTAVLYKLGFLTLTGTGQVVYFDWTNPASLVVKQVFTLPVLEGRAPPAPNSVRVDLCCGTQGTGSPDSHRVIITDYSLDETYSGPKPVANGNLAPLPQPYGVVQEAGTKQIHVIIFNATSVYLDPRFKLDLATRFPDKVYNPRGIAVFPTTNGGGS